jgi:transposase|tara:strand:+ start:461 stop:967 length:507 start_codon:yes stop_codon:yes gene_type:complete
MQGRHPELNITLGDEEVKYLKKILRSKKTEFRLVQRAKIIILASENRYRNTEIGDKVGCSRESVRHWKKSFHKFRLEGLKDRPRSGKPPEFTAKQRAEILALATKKPIGEGLHFTDWSTRDLAKHAIEKKIVKSIHWTTINDWLKNSDIKPHKWEYWLNSNDPHFKKK